MLNWKKHPTVSVEGPEAVSEANDFVATLVPYGVTFVSHLAFDQAGNIRVFSSSPEESARCIEPGALERDPVVLMAFKSARALIPWSALYISREHRKFFLDHPARKGIYDGLSINFKHNNIRHLVSLATSLPTMDILGFCAENPRILRDCITFFQRFETNSVAA